MALGTRIGEKDPDELIPGDEQIPVQIIIDKHPLAFSGTGLLNDEEVAFYIDHTVPLVASSYRPVQFAYREVPIYNLHRSKQD